MFDERGEYTNGLVLFQLKSTDRPNLTDMGLTIDLSSRDLELWLYSTLPMVLFLYDAQQNVTRYVNLREYFEQNRTALRDVRKFVRIYIPPASIFDVEAMQNLRATINF